MTLADLNPFTAAVKAHGARVVMPTNMGSAQLQQLDANILRTSMTSAKTLFSDLLDGYAKDIGSIINPVTTQREDRVTAENPQGNVTTGLNPTQARVNAKNLLRKIGYSPEPGKAGTLQDLSSDARINLVVKTNVETAQGAGHFIQSNDPAVLDQFPAQELVRFEQTAKQRDWPVRWLAAADESGDEDAARVFNETGRMVALKASPIWDSLGNGAGGYSDGLGNPYPPFAFGSGMWVRSVARPDAEAIGLIEPGQSAEAHPLDLSNLFSIN